MPRAGLAPGPEHDYLVAYAVAVLTSFAVVTVSSIWLSRMGLDISWAATPAVLALVWRFSGRISDALDAADAMIALRSDVSR